MPLGYGDEQVSKVTGNPDSTSNISCKEAVPDESTLKAGFIQDKQLVPVASLIAVGKAAN
jgi:hypothetical protein